MITGKRIFYTIEIIILKQVKIHFSYFFTWCLGRPTMDGKTALGASSPANPALHMPEPLSTTKAATSSSHILISVCWAFKIQRKWDLTVCSSIDVWSKSQVFTSLYLFFDGQIGTHFIHMKVNIRIWKRISVGALCELFDKTYLWAKCPWNN